MHAYIHRRGTTYITYNVCIHVILIFSKEEAYKHTCMHTSTKKHTHIYKCSNIPKTHFQPKKSCKNECYIHTYIHTYINTYNIDLFQRRSIHTYMHAYIHSKTHTHMSSNIPKTHFQPKKWCKNDTQKKKTTKQCQQVHDVEIEWCQHLRLTFSHTACHCD